MNRYTNTSVEPSASSFDDMTQQDAINTISQDSQNKVFQGDSTNGSNRFMFIEDAYNDLFKVRGEHYTFADRVSEWLDRGLSPADIRLEIRRDLNFEPSIAEVSEILNHALETKVSAHHRIKFKKAYTKYMTKIGNNMYKTAHITWQVKAYKDSDGYERMYLVRIEDSRKGN
jgi:hypothetical protein